MNYFEHLYSKILLESLNKGERISGYKSYKDEYVEIIKNPSNREIWKQGKDQAWMKEVGLLITTTDMYLFNRENDFHKNVAQFLGLKSFVGLLYNYQSKYAFITDATSKDLQNTKKAVEMVENKLVPIGLDDVGMWNEDEVGNWEYIGQTMPVDKWINEKDNIVTEGRAATSKEIDLEYFNALRQGNEQRMEQILDYASSRKELESATHDIYYAFTDIEDIEKEKMFSEFRSGKPQSWSTFPEPRILKIYRDFAKYGFIRDIKGLDSLGDLIITNIAKLNINTVLAGHTQFSPIEYFDLEDLGGEGEDIESRLAEWVPDGFFSDYAMQPLVEDALRILSSVDPTQKLIAIDRALNRIHQRGDIAAFFLSGGRKTLNKLAGKPEIKLVEKDKNGNVIPPSVRFNLK